MYSAIFSVMLVTFYVEPVTRCTRQWTTPGGVVCRGEESMAEGVQSVQQGERLATPTPPVSPQSRHRWRRRTVWLVVLLLGGGLAGTAAWQRWDLQSVWQRLGLQPIEE